MAIDIPIWEREAARSVANMQGGATQPIWEREAARTVDNIKGNPKRVKKTKAAKAPNSAKSVGEKAAKEAIDGMKKGSSWRPPNETPRPTPASSVASKAPGLLSKWGGRALTGLRVLGGPVSVAIQAGILPGDLGDSNLESPQGGASNWVNENPEEAVSATQRINNLISRGIQGAKEKWAPPPVQEQEVAPQALPQVPEPAPEQQQQQIEIQRQTVEIGALKGLETGQVSRPSLAEAIVEADAQRAGEQLTPEQSKQAVQQELTSMKTMDNKDLSKYVSYALIAGGVLASFMDKSGKAEGMFHDSFNRQLDRGEEAKAQAAAAEQAALKYALDERKVSATEADIGSKVEDREETRGLTKLKTEGLLGKWENDAVLGNSRLANERARTGIMGSRLSMDAQDKNIKNNLATRKLDQYDRRLDQWDAKLKQDAAGGGASGGTGVPLSYEDNTKLVSDVLSAKGVKVSKEVKQALAARLPTIQKLAPDLSATQMTEIALEELKGEVSIQDTSTFNGWMGKDMKYSFDKLK